MTVRRTEAWTRVAPPAGLSVLVDGRHLSEFGSTRGFGRYLRGLLGELGRGASLEISALVTDTTVLPAGIRPIVVRRQLPGRLADLEHRARLPLDIALHRSALFHSPGHEPPRFCGRPWVQTLHDIPLVFAGADGDAERERWRRRRRHLSAAAAVVAVSRHVAGQAISLLGLDPGRVHVVGHGVDPVFRSGADRPSTSVCRACDQPYVLLVSEYGPHKGYQEAFGVIDLLAERGLPHKLVVVGRLAPWWRPVVEGLRSDADHPERIELAGLADDAALADWYRGADALVVTSRSEGFGLPIIEAMACGTPVVAFDNTALPEVVGNGGLLVRDGDVPALARTLHGLLTDAPRWEEAAAAARERSRAFSWERSAAAYVEIFKQAAAR